MKTDRLLTPREREILGLLAIEGLTVKQVADRMCVVVQCIYNHLQVMYDKAGVNRATHSLVSWWYRQNFGITFDIPDKARKIGAMLLLALFAVEVTNTNLICRVMRARRGRRHEVEFLIEG